MSQQPGATDAERRRNDDEFGRAWEAWRRGGQSGPEPRREDFGAGAGQPRSHRAGPGVPQQGGQMELVTVPEDTQTRYLRQIRNSVVFLAWVVGVQIALAVIIVLWVLATASQQQG